MGGTKGQRQVSAIARVRVIGYVRVSTEDQAREGTSLGAQEARIRAYCTARDWLLVDLVRDEASAKDVKRPGLQAILGALARRERPFDAIVVTKLDRLTRSVQDLGMLTERFRRGRVTFTSIAEAVDTSTAAGELFHTILAALSQWERKTIGERTKASLSYLRSRGRRVSRWAPYGFQLAPGGELEPHVGERAVLEEITALATSGLTLRAISLVLYERGVVARNGRPFAPSTLSRLVPKGSVTNRAGVEN